MSKDKRPSKPRSLIIKDMILSGRGKGGSAGGPMKDRRKRRPKDSKNDPIKQDDEELSESDLDESDIEEYVE